METTRSKSARSADLATPQARQVRAARIAGAAYLAILALGVFSEFYVRAPLILQGDAAQNVVEHEGLFRITLATNLLGFSGLAVLTVALYVLLRPVGRTLAVLASFWWLGESVLLCVAELASLTALALLSGGGEPTGLDAGQLHGLAELALRVRGVFYNVGLIPFGLGSTVFSYLLLRSGYVPRVLAAWGVFSSLLALTSALWLIVSPVTGAVAQLVGYAPIFLYELLVGSWLLLKGARID